MLQKPPTFSAQDCEILKREVLYQGVFRLSRFTLRHRLFKGDWSLPFTREVFERKSAAAILPYDPVLNSVVLIEQFRVGILADHALSIPRPSPWLIEIVAGVYDPDETPESTALRESQEEAGCTILDIYPICQYYPSPGGSNEHLHLYCGRVDASSTVEGIYGLAEEHEDIRAFTLPLPEALTWIEQGKIKTGPAIISLQWLILNQERLQTLWRKNP